MTGFKSPLKGDTITNRQDFVVSLEIDKFDKTTGHYWVAIASVAGHNSTWDRVLELYKKSRGENNETSKEMNQLISNWHIDQVWPKFYVPETPYEGRVFDGGENPLKGIEPQPMILLILKVDGTKQNYFKNWSQDGAAIKGFPGIPASRLTPNMILARCEIFLPMINKIGYPPSAKEIDSELAKPGNVIKKEAKENHMNPVKKILIISSNPKTKPRLRFEEEVREIQEGLQRSKYRDKFDIQSRWAVRLRDLRRALLDVEPQIVHFAGHGKKDGLLVEDELGFAVRISQKALSDLFGLCANHVECVILDSCYSEPQAVAIGKHIDYVIGMKREINDKAVIEFAVGFYDALGAGKPVEQAFKFGCNAILQVYPDLPEHLIPVLLTRKCLKSKERRKYMDKKNIGPWTRGAVLRLKNSLFVIVLGIIANIISHFFLANPYAIILLVFTLISFILIMVTSINDKLTEKILIPIFAIVYLVFGLILLFFNSEKALNNDFRIISPVHGEFLYINKKFNIGGVGIRKKMKFKIQSLQDGNTPCSYVKEPFIFKGEDRWSFNGCRLTKIGSYEIRVIADETKEASVITIKVREKLGIWHYFENFFRRMVKKISR